MFQTIFGMIFTVIIALEFKRSLVVMAERRDSVVQVRAVVVCHECRLGMTMRNCTRDGGGPSGIGNQVPGIDVRLTSPSTCRSRVLM